jgi:AGCS family alanine or glycine:cation symporter
MNIAQNIIETISNSVGGVLFADVLFFLPNVKLPFLIFWIILGCLYYTFKLEFVNFRYFLQSLKIFFEKEKLDESGKTITSRSAFIGAISGCVGVGSIAGVAAAVYYGGPGVVVWLLMGAFLAMPLRFAEVYLGHHFREKDKDGNIVLYGPFAYIKNGLALTRFKAFAKPMTIFFALGLFLTSISAIMGQAGPTSELVSHTFFDDNKMVPIFVAIMLASFTLIVIFGGLSRISRVMSSLTIAMSLLYISIILMILAVNYHNIIPSIKLVFRSAFELKSVYGGAIGIAVVALTRIISMNEVGMGTVAILHGKSKNENSAKEAMLAMSGPFIAILIFVALNSFAVIVTGAHLSGANGVIMIKQMFEATASFLPFFLVIIVLLFAITTLIAWYFYVETALLELPFGKLLTKIYPVVFICCVIFASLIPYSAIIQFTDVLGIAIIIPNVFVLYVLSGKVKQGLKSYLESKKL